MIAARRGVGGFTLLELIVSMAVISIGFGVAATAITRTADSSDDAWISELRARKSEATRTGRPMVAWHDSAQTIPPVLFLPDGRRVGSMP
jgi:prepilin-type N-terminal cleavage/methylation domain-containing protein